MPEGPLGAPRPFVPTDHVSLLKLGGDKDNVEHEPTVDVLTTMDEDMGMSEELLDRVDKAGLRAYEEVGVVEESGMVYDYIPLDNLSTDDIIAILEGVQNTPGVDEVKFISSEELTSTQGPLGVPRPFVSTEQVSFLEFGREIETIDRVSDYPMDTILDTVDGGMDVEDEVVIRIDRQFGRSFDMGIDTREEDGMAYSYIPLDELQLDDIIVLLEAVQEAQHVEARFISKEI